MSADAGGDGASARRLARREARHDPFIALGSGSSRRSTRTLLRMASMVCLAEWVLSCKRRGSLGPLA